MRPPRAGKTRHQGAAPPRTGRTETPAFRLQLERYVWALLAVWTAVVGTSLAWNVVGVNREMLELARLQARVAYEKDVIYRRWNAQRGPVYVPVTERTQPNPYLARTPERDVTTASGKRLTMMNPAYMTRLAHELMEEQSGARGHITSLNPIRPANAPDPWETEALKAFDRGQAEISSVEKIGGRDYMRLMGVLVTESSCLPCHSEQGYKVGDVRGGISVSIPMGPLWGVLRRHEAALSLGHGLIWLVGMAGLVIGGQRLRARRDAIEVKNAQLAERSRQVQRAYELLDHEFKVVADVQVSLLPPRVPEIPGFEGATHYRPATRAGGDYFDFFGLSQGRWGVLVADVSGHGAPAAVVMAMTRVILHTSSRMQPPDQVLADVNDALCSNILSGQFVTCCYGVLDPGARTFAFASAGHPAPLLYDPASGRAQTCATPGGFPLGIDSDAHYAAGSVALAPGSVLVFYTDGITEALSQEGEQFGEARLTRAIEARAGDGAEAVREGILAALDAHRGSVDLADDTTLVILRALATA